ncbi:hypothetical protein [Sphingopyxis sp. DBS4]|uniref:hypothetical protein n=1 Tax=Sphingopyxis sp. DBS4 TaxID=2968500 RepID=UPI00214BE705|nr:hypothetical protein [Sphingopyxis sp. DBS4]
MARDDFSRAVVDRLAKRVGMRCSNPDCRQPTSGPDAAGGTTNVGVAAHISAASPGGARYDETLTPEQRSDIANGIWLCQRDAKLIDDDELSFPPTLLREWKDTAEKMAALEARGYSVSKASPFPALERKMPELIAEMRADLMGNKLVRQFILLKKGWAYNPGSTPYFQYFFDDHPQIKAMMTIMIHAGAIYDIKFNSVDRYNFTEPFVSYLIGE